MKVLLMAAGMGRRINYDIQGLPKCMVDIGGTTLIQNTIELLKHFNIQDIGLVLGYKGQLITEHLSNYDLRFYFNPFFNITNSIASLWFARDFIMEDEDYILLNADVYFEGQLLQLILKEPLNPVLFVDELRVKEADYRFYCEGNKLVNHGKHLLDEETTGEYIGIAKIGKPFMPRFRLRLEEMIQKQQSQLWWENILYSFIGETDVYVKSVEQNFWGEVDLIQDYHRIVHYRQKKNSQTLSSGSKTKV